MEEGENEMIEEVKDKNALNLDLSETARTKIWVNGDNRRVLELNLTDLGIMGRAKDAKDKLDELQAEANELASADVPDSIESDEDEKKIDVVIERFSSIDKKMRELVDGIFDFPVCDVCCDGGSMYDPINGQYRYEYIIDKVMALYGDQWEKESKLRKQNIEKHTSKYTKSRKKK